MSHTGLGKMMIWPQGIAYLGLSGTISGAFGVQGATLDAADEAIGQVFIAPRTASIDRVLFRTRTVTTGATVNVSIEPIGTGSLPAFAKALWGTNTEASQVILATDDNVWFEVTLTAAASVTINDQFAVVVRNPSASPGNLQISQVSANSQLAQRARVGHFSVEAYGAPPTAFVAQSETCAMAFRYSDTLEWHGTMLATAFSDAISQTFNSGTATTRMGNRFKMPVSTTIAGGIFAASNMTAGSAGNIVLRDDSGTQLATGAWNGNYMSGTTMEEWYPVLFSTPYAVAANTWYRITVEPTNTNNITTRGCDYGHEAMRYASVGGVDFHRTLYTSGAWDDTGTLLMGGCLPIVSEVPSSAPQPTFAFLGGS